MAGSLSSPESSIQSEQNVDAEYQENTNRDEVIMQNDQKDQFDQYSTDLPIADNCNAECSSPHVVGVASSSTDYSARTAESCHDGPVQENQVAGSRRDETQLCQNGPRFSQYMSAPMCEIDHQCRSVPTIGCHGLPLRPWAKECHKWQGLDCAEGEVPVCPYGPDCKFHHSWPPKRSSSNDSAA